jgi:hypothetical protein
LGEAIDVFQIIIYNIGTVTSYLSSIKYRVICNNESIYKIHLDIPNNSWYSQINPKINSPIEPGRKLAFQFPLNDTAQSLYEVENSFFSEVIITDEIDNSYSFIIESELNNKIKMSLNA